MAKKTIAIIGATASIGAEVAKKLSKAGYRLLLFAHNAGALTSLVNKIKRHTPNADISGIGCAGDASWEADIIISTVALNENEELGKKIEPFANRKILIYIFPNHTGRPLIAANAVRETKRLQKSILGAKVIGLFNISFGNEAKGSGIIVANDQDALQTVREILDEIGYKKAHSINYSTRFIEKII